jgi:hypothetical protein
MQFSPTSSVPSLQTPSVYILPLIFYDLIFNVSLFFIQNCMRLNLSILDFCVSSLFTHRLSPNFTTPDSDQYDSPSIRGDIKYTLMPCAIYQYVINRTASFHQE